MERHHFQLQYSSISKAWFESLFLKLVILIIVFMTATGFELVGKIFIVATGFELVGKTFINATGSEPVVIYSLPLPGFEPMVVTHTAARPYSHVLDFSRRSFTLVIDSIHSILPFFLSNISNSLNYIRDFYSEFYPFLLLILLLQDKFLGLTGPSLLSILRSLKNFNLMIRSIF